MNITQNFLSMNQWSRSGKKISDIRGIVIHWVGNPNSTAIENRNYFNSLNDIYASAHYIVGLQGEIIQCLPEDEVAYHSGATSYNQAVYERLSGSPNYHTIGIETCHIDWNGTYNQSTYNTTIELAAYLCKKYGLDPIADLWRHYDVTGKDCPKWFVNNPNDWSVFKNAVATKMGSTSTSNSGMSGQDYNVITGPAVTTTSKSSQGGHIVNISDNVMKDTPIYNHTKKLDGIQTHAKGMKNINFKQDYIVIIRKKLYYAISAQDEEKYLRVYQVNNFTNIRTSHSVYGRPASCSITLKGAERVICAENQEVKDQNWENWEHILHGWVQDNSQGDEHKDWRIGKASFELPGAAGTDFKSLLKTREAKYGWRFAEKCDWKPMDEIYVFGKSHNAKYKDAKGEYEYLPIFFGFIDSISKTFTAGTGGPVMNISASDQLKLMQLSRVVNNPSKMPGVISGGGLDIKWNFPQDGIGCFAINDDFLNGNNSENNIVYATLQNVFAGLEPYKFINRLALDAGIPEKYLTKRIEKITKIPFVQKLANRGAGDLLNAETRTRLEVCQQAAEKLMVEFFADETGNIVFKIPNYALGINRLKDNNMGYTYRQDIMDATDSYWVDANGNKVDLAQLQKEAQAAANAGQKPEKPQIIQTENAIEYKVVSGDSLWYIAKKFLGDGNKWKKIYDDNYAVIGKDPNSIRPGMILKIYKVDPNNVQTIKAAERQASADNIGSLQDTLNNKQIKLVQGKTLSQVTDEWIPAILPEEIISFTLTDTDKEIYNMYEIQMEVPMIEFANLPQAIKRVVPDFDSIVQLGMRPHPAVINTPLISSRQEAEYFGTMMIGQSLANRFSGTLNLIEDSSIRIGDPIRVFMYDEHPYKETGLFPQYGAQSVFYVVGIERSIDVKNVSSMTLQLKAGRMMGQESIFDIFMPLYKYYYEDQEIVDFKFDMEAFNVEPSIPYTIQVGDTLSKIITNQLKISSNDGTKFNDLVIRIVRLNWEFFGGTTVTPNVGETLSYGQILNLPKNP